MSADPDLSGEYRAVTNRNRAGNTYLRHQQALLPNADVVRDVDEVVDLGAVADDGIVDAPAIDRRVGTNLDIVANDAPPDVRDFLMCAIAKDVTEPVAADPGARVHECTRTQSRSGIDGDTGPQSRTGANRDSISQYAVRTDNHVVAQIGTSANDRILTDGDAPTQRYAPSDARRRGDAWSG